MAKAKKSQGKKNGKRRPQTGARTATKNAPIAVRPRTTIRLQPKQQLLRNGDIRVTHRELLGATSSAGTGFYRDLFNQINAGNPNFAPWLAGVAIQYESYVFESLTFEYEPQVPTTFAGTMWMTADYDPTDAAPSDVRSFSITPGSVSCPIHSPAKLVCRPEDLKKRAPSYFVRTVGSSTASTSSGNSVLRSTDTGNFFTGFTGCVNAAGSPYTGVCGYIWVKYTVRLITPQPSLPPVGAYATLVRNRTTNGGVPDYVSLAGSSAFSLFDSNMLTPFDPETLPKVTSTGNYLVLLKTLANAAAGGTTGLSSVATGLVKNGVQQLSNLKTGGNSSGRLNSISAFVQQFTAGDTIDIGNRVTPSSTDVPITTLTDFAFIPLAPNAYSMVNQLFTVSNWATQSGVCRFTGVSGTAANPLGTGNVKEAGAGVEYAAGELTVPPGSWVLSYQVTGTSLVPGTLTLPGNDYQVVNAGATLFVAWCEWSSDSEEVIDISLTSGTITASNLILSNWYGDADGLS